MTENIPKIDSCLGYNQCKEHTNFYISDRLPCPYPNCAYSVNSDKFIEKSDLVNKETVYIRKSFNGINGNTKYIWIRENEFFLKISSIINDEVFKYFNHQENKNIYHYTSLDTLFKILESNELWLTEWKCTNDTSEIQHGLDIVNKINNELNFEQIIHKNNYFIASFSYEINNVTLFDRYAENAEGVAIGFDTKHDWQNINENFWIKNYDFMKLLPVIYDKTIQEKIIEYGFYIYKIVKEWLFNAKNAYNSQNNLITNEKKEAGLESLFLRYLEETISFFKNSAFLDEREVRLLYTYDYDFIKKYELHIDKKKFNNKNYYTSTDTHDMSFENYHEFSQEKYKIKLPIKNIVLGSRVKNKEQIVNQIKEQCKKFGFQNVDIQISDIPLR